MILTKENIVNEIKRISRIQDVKFRLTRMDDYKLHLFRKSDYMPFKIVMIDDGWEYPNMTLLLKDMNGDITLRVESNNISNEFYTYDEYKEIYDNNECCKYAIPYALSTDKNHLTFLQTDRLGMYLYRHEETNKVFIFTDPLLKQIQDPENMDAVCEKMSGDYVEMPVPQ